MACLTNYAEMENGVVIGTRSRGAIVTDWLMGKDGHHETPKSFEQHLQGTGQLKETGGFVLIYGQLQDVVAHCADNSEGGEHKNKSNGLFILSNRPTRSAELSHIVTAPNETIAVSNAPFGDRSWPKLVDGETLLLDAIKSSVEAKDSKDELIERLMAVLSNDKIPWCDGSEDTETFLRHMKSSVCVRKIPLQGSSTGIIGNQPKPTAAPSRAESPGHHHIYEGEPEKSTNPETGENITSEGYATTQQTVILVSREGEVTYAERTLWDADGKRIPDCIRDRGFTFKIENC